MNTNMALPRHPSGPRRKRDWLDRLASGKVCFFCLLATALAFGFGLLLVLRRYPALLRGVLDLELSRVVSFFMPAAGLALITTIVLGLAVINALRGPLVVVGRTLSDWLRKIVAAIGWSLGNFLVRPVAFVVVILIILPLLALFKLLGQALKVTWRLLKWLALALGAVVVGVVLSKPVIWLGLGLGYALKIVVNAIGVGLYFLIEGLIGKVSALAKMGGKVLTAVWLGLVRVLKVIGRGLQGLARLLGDTAVALWHLSRQLTARHTLLFAFTGALISGGTGIAIANSRYPGWLRGDPSLDKVIPVFVPAIAFATLTLLLLAYVGRNSLRRGMLRLGQAVGNQLNLFKRMLTAIWRGLKNSVLRPLALIFRVIGQGLKWLALGGFSVGLLLVKFLWRIGRGLLKLLGLTLRALWLGVRILILRPLVLIWRAVVYLLGQARRLIWLSLKSLFRLLQRLWATLTRFSRQLTARHLLLVAFIGALISGGGGIAMANRRYPDWLLGDPSLDKVIPFFIPAIVFAALTLLLSAYVWREPLRRGVIRVGQMMGKVFGLALRAIWFALRNFSGKPLAFLWSFLLQPMLRLMRWALPRLVKGFLILGAAAGLIFAIVQVVRSFTENWSAVRASLATLVSVLLIIVFSAALTMLLAVIVRILFTSVVKPAARVVQSALKQLTAAIGRLLWNTLVFLGRGLVSLARNTATAARLHPRAAMTLALPVVLLSGGLGWLWTDGTLCLWGFQRACQPSPPPPPPLCSPAAPSGALEICIVTSGTKADWVRDTTKTFNAAQFKIASGKPISVTVTEADSGDFLPGLREGRIVSPIVWSPGEISWVNEANVYWQERYGKPLVIGAQCSPTVYAIIGIGMWQPMAEAMGWPNEPISWDQFVELTADPQGWARYGHAEWGQFKFGHTHPGYSNTGFLAMASLVYNTLDRTNGLTPEMVKSPAVVEAFRQLELHTDRYGTSTRSLFTFMATKGPDFLHAGTNSESGVFATNKFNKDQMRFPLVFIIPADGAFWSENPYCVIDEAWVTAEQREAAQIYEDYLLAREQQDRAMDFGLRPTDPNIPLRAPMTADWTDVHATPRTIPRLESVSGEAAAAIKDVFQQTKKKATIVVVLDASGSMQGEKMTNAVEASANFLKRLNKNDEVVVFAFGDTVAELQPSGRAGAVVEALGETLRALPAQGRTALYDAICAGTDRLAQLKTAHEAEGEQRLYGLVILSDGQDTASRKSQDFMYLCLPQGEEVGDAKVFTIAYGVDADKELLEDIARRTNGRAFSGDPATIEQVYLAISAEQ